MSDVIPPPKNDANRPGLGGPVERSSLTLAIYGADLVPEDISRQVGIRATRGFLKGEKSGRAAERGAWFYSLEAVAPQSPEQLLEQVALALREQGIKALAGLSRKYEVQLRFVLRMEGYNRGFDISPASARLIASIGASVGFSIYSED